MSEENKNEQAGEDSKLVGLLAQFDDPNSLVNACNEAREAGYKKMDAYSPFPVHGIDPAIGIKRTILPFIVLFVGINACFIGLGMQFYTNGGIVAGASTDQSPLFPGYQFNISGKPYFSAPANIPVTFEVIVLSSAFATFFGMWLLNGLPRFSNPLHRISRFSRATNDKFFLMIEEKDEKFERSGTESQLNQWGAVAIEECRQDLTDNELPSWLRLGLLLGALLLILPPVMVFRSMGMTNTATRLHFMPDMDWQDKSKTQQLAYTLNDGERLFADERVMRAPVEGSVQWKPESERNQSSEYLQGIKSGGAGHDGHATVVSLRSHTLASTNATDDGEEDLSAYVTEFPHGIEVNEELLARGQERFNIYCSVCHGYAGKGDGLVNERALALALNGKANWTAARSLHDADVKDGAKNPLGRIFQTISKGRGTMGPYEAQITTKDRWAIVAYVKALQETGLKSPAKESAAETPAATPATEVPTETPAAPTVEAPAVEGPGVIGEAPAAVETPTSEGPSVEGPSVEGPSLGAPE